MLTRLRLRNFRAFRDTGEISLFPLTVIIGANNTGKSTLINALLLLKQTLQSESEADPLITAGSAVDLGSYYDILRGGHESTARWFEIGVETSTFRLNLERPLPSRSWPSARRRLHVDFSVRFGFDRREGRVQVLAFHENQEGRPVLAWTRSEGLTNAFGEQSRQLGRIPVTVDGLFPRIYPYRAVHFPKNSRYTPESISRQSFYNRYEWKDIFERVNHVEPIRPDIPRYAILGKTSGIDQVGGETLLRKLREESQAGVGDESLLSELDRWLGSRWRMLKKVRIHSLDSGGTILELLGDEKHGYRNINVANMGKGIAQVLPILTEVATTRRQGTALIEQPEIHLHPDAQANLGDLLIDTVRPSRGRQVIVETHSEHLLLRIRRRVAEGKIPPDSVAILYVERQGDESVVRRLEVDKKGNVPGWPHGFFEQGYEEALGLAEAGLRRR